VEFRTLSDADLQRKCPTPGGQITTWKILSLVCQLLADAAVLPAPLVWLVRIGVPLSAILISMGFFFSMMPPTATQPNGAVSLIYVGAVVLAASVLTLAIGLIRTPA
jgi:hypothetical protein